MMRQLSRNNVIEKLREKWIETTIGTYSLHVQPYYIKKYGYKEGDLDYSWEAHKRSITLPLYVNVRGRDIYEVVNKPSPIINEEVFCREGKTQ